MKTVIDYLKNKFAKKKKINPEYKGLLKNEKEFLKKYKNSTFSFFGYLSSDDEIPFFEHIKSSDTFENGQKFNVSEMVRPFTPDTLSHCVYRLNHECKLEEAKNLELFKKKCKQYAINAKYQDCDWNKTIENLSLFLATVSLEDKTPTK